MMSQVKQETDQVKEVIGNIIDKNLAKIVKNKSINCRITIVGKNQIIGLDEVLNATPVRRETVVCYSTRASTYFIERAQFRSVLGGFGLLRISR